MSAARERVTIDVCVLAMALFTPIGQSCALLDHCYLQTIQLLTAAVGIESLSIVKKLILHDFLTISTKHMIRAFWLSISHNWFPVALQEVTYILSLFTKLGSIFFFFNSCDTLYRTSVSIQSFSGGSKLLSTWRLNSRISLILLTTFSTIGLLQHLLYQNYRYKKTVWRS